MEALNDLFNSFRTYFNTLSVLGYKSQADVNRLLAYDFIMDMLTGDMKYFVTEEDYKVIEKALSCLYGSSCLIPYPNYIADTKLFGHPEEVNFIGARITQDNNIRVTESKAIRFKA